MTGTRRLNIEALNRHLRDARRHGARASRLLHYTPELVELLYPAEQYPQLDAHDRAITTETLIRQAIDAIGGDAGHALAIILCLTPGTLGCTLDDRRRMAADHLGIRADTWKRGWREGALFRDLLLEIYQLRQSTSDREKKPSSS